jgi:NADH-quinone oxidoreductase subunit H
MDLGWKVLIPLSLGWFLVLTGVRVASEEGWNAGQIIATGLVGFAGLAVGAGLLVLSIRSAASKRAAIEAGDQV